MDLDPRMQTACQEHMRVCKENGIELLITCTYRSGEEQDALYAQGRTAPGKIITNAKAGQSAHNVMNDGKPSAKAYDCVPLLNGKPVWGTSGDDLALWRKVGQIGKALGLEWAGDWKWSEFPHFQEKGWRPHV